MRKNLWIIILLLVVIAGGLIWWMAAQRPYQAPALLVPAPSPDADTTQAIQQDIDSAAVENVDSLFQSIDADLNSL